MVHPLGATETAVCLAEQQLSAQSSPANLFFLHKAAPLPAEELAPGTSEEDRSLKGIFSALHLSTAILKSYRKWSRRDVLSLRAHRCPMDTLLLGAPEDPVSLVKGEQTESNY